VAVNEDYVKVWRKRIDTAKKAKEEYEKVNRVNECYSYWRGDQLVEPFDEFGNRRAQINKIHPEVKNNLPGLYFYRPFARLTTAPEVGNDPGSEVDAQTSLLQDTANHLIRDPETRFKEATHLALKEAHWAFGLVEAGYSAEFKDAPNAERPPLKENKDTKITGGKDSTQVGKAEPAVDELGLSVGEDSDYESMLAEVQKLQGQLKSEKFFVKFIPAKQALISSTDKAILEENDWVGYYEDVPLEDVKRSKGYKNLKDLKASTGDEKRDASNEEYCERTGTPKSVRLFKIWDLRTKVRYVFAEGHNKCLLQEAYKRCPLKFLRFDVDPYHFFPRPPLLSKLGPQDDYNQSREYIRKERNSRVSRYTYDDDAIEVGQMQKLETGEMGIYIPRKAGTTNVIEPVNQPSFSGEAVQSLTLSDKEFADVGGVGGDAKVAATKTATQAKIAETKLQAQDSFERTQVAEWLGEVVRELLSLAIERMNLDRWIAINVPADSLYQQQLAMDIGQKFEKINANILSDEAAGVRWDVVIDVESLSPVSEEEKFQKLLAGLQTISAPPLARLFSVSPPLLKMFLDGLGIKSAKDQEIISGSMQQVVQMEMQLAAQSQNSATGVSGQAAPGQPTSPSPGGGPQPGSPPGPGASMPKAGG